MQTFKRILVSVICFILTISVICTAITFSAEKTEQYYYYDIPLRNRLAGKIDFLISGSSHTMCAFDPKEIDPILNCNSYILSCTQMNFIGLSYFINRELERNPVKTVVLEIHSEAFATIDYVGECEGARNLLCRLDSPKDKLSYLLTSGLFLHLDLILKSSLPLNVEALKAKYLHGDTFTSKVIDVDKGYHKKQTNDVSLSSDEAKNIHNSKEDRTEINQDYWDSFTKLVHSCNEHGANVIIVVSPVSDNTLWTVSNLDKVFSPLKDFCKENNIGIYDFNLLKNKNSFFNDKESFYDETHLSTTGSQVFSRLFAETLVKVQNREDVSDMFYGSYSEAEQYNIYNQK